MTRRGVGWGGDEGRGNEDEDKDVRRGETLEETVTRPSGVKDAPCIKM